MIKQNKMSCAPREDPDQPENPGYTSSAVMSYNLDDSNCTCSRCGWGLFGHFYSPLSFLFSFYLSLGDGPIKTEILSERAVKPKTTN